MKDVHTYFLGVGGRQLRPRHCMNLYKDCILGDTGAGASIFWNKDLLSNIRSIKEPYRIRGIGNKCINVYKEGDSIFGPVGYHNEAGMNVLSIGDIIDICEHISIDKENHSLVLQMIKNGPIYIFKRVNKQFICNLKTNVINVQYDIVNHVNRFVGVSTVTERMRIFSRAELLRADEAKELQRILGYPSAGQLIKQLQLGKIETNVTSSDVVNSVYIYGRSIGECKGKTTARKQDPEIPQPIPFTGQRVWNTLYCDLMFEGDLTFLVMVVKPIDYTFLGKLNSRKGVDIWTVMSKALRQLYNRGYKVSVGYIDGEKATQAHYLQQELWNSFQFELDISGAAEAVPVIENRIKNIKNKMRAIYHTLPFETDSTLMTWLARYATLRLCSEISNTSKDGLSPRERLHGRRSDKAWIRHGFGDYCQVHDKNTSNKIKKERTQGAIALAPTGNMSGTWYYLVLKTWSVVTRNGATPLPMPQEVIDYINYKTIKKRIVLNELPEILENDYLPEDVIANQQPELVTPVGGEDILEGDGHDDIDVNVDDEDDGLTNQIQQQTLDGIDVDEQVVDKNNIDNSVPENVLNNVMDDYDNYTRVDGTESQIDRNVRIKDRNYIKQMLHGPIDRFVGLGLQMELHEAIRKYGERAVQSAADEIKQILKKKVWRGVTLEEEKNDYDTIPIPSSMKVKEKFKSGLLERLKSRLTGGGHKMNKELYSDIKYAPTVSTTAVMITACIAAAENRAVATLDFTGAFLYADMPNDKERATLVRLGQYLTKILVKLDSSYQKYVRANGTCVVVLDKALYGTIIAASAWYKKISGDMKDLGYKISEYDNCVFFKYINGKQIIAALHVDDFFLTAAGGESDLDIVINEIKTRYDEVTVNRGKLLTYLGITFDFSKEGEVSLSMTDYVDNAVKLYEDTYGILGVSKTPANDDIFKVDESSGFLDTNKAKDYHSHVMRAQYLAKHQRFDIVFPVSILNKRVKKPSNKDWNDLEKLLKYLKTTRDRKLTLRPGDLNTITAYIDASFGVHPDMKGHAGCVTLLGNAPIYVKASAGKLNTKSTTEEELCGVYEHTNTPIWSRNFLKEVGYGKQITTIKQDNKSTISLIREGRAKALSTKHIDRRYFYVKNLIERKEVIVDYCRTDMMIADILTKALSGFYFERMRDKLMDFGNINLVPLLRRQRKRVTFDTNTK